MIEKSRACFPPISYPFPNFKAGDCSQSVYCANLLAFMQRIIPHPIFPIVGTYNMQWIILIIGDDWNYKIQKILYTQIL